MGWDGNLYFYPTTNNHPITITQLSDTSTIPYHLPQLLPSHPTHHDETSYHPNTIPSVSHLSHVHTNTIVYHPKPSIRNLLRDVPTHLPADHSFSTIAHQYINHLQTWRTLPPSVSVSLPDHSHLRACKLPQCLLLAPLRLQLLLAPRLVTSGARAVLRGAGTGKNKRTSGVWQYFDLFDPPDAVGKNIRCNVRRSLPAAGMLPGRTSMCGARFKYVSADRTSGVHGTGTSGFLNHCLERSHPTEHMCL